MLEASSSEEGKTHFGNMNNLSQASSEFSIRTDLKADEQRQGVPLQGQIVKQDGGADTLPQSTVGPDWVQNGYGRKHCWRFGLSLAAS